MKPGRCAAQGAAAGRWIVCALLLLSPNARVAAQTPPEPPAPPWKEFIKTQGHDNEIPVGWVETPEGRFAHDIVLPDSIPKTVPFDFAMARLRALKPGSKSVARQYWEHLCGTEAGSFILKPVDGVDGFFFMRAVGGANEQQNNDRWKLEAPGMQASWGWSYDPEREAVAFVQPPSATYEWVDFPARTGSGFLHLHDYEESALKVRADGRAVSDAKYLVVWRGVHRDRDRANAISGVEWIVLSRENNTVLGVLRDFYATGGTRNRPQGISWLNASQCTFKRDLLGRSGERNDIAVWAPMVLRPKVKPGILKFVEEQRARTGK
jgi:hypothetical protein